ncbi:MAG: GIY-YIG nuclease family protein, partial [Candidatus Obscuribacterales bacterium]|nr:GIY-YIG nuclease family protein [Candidatus Obscuribacterales bacterium]
SLNDRKNASRPDLPVDLRLFDYPVLILDCQTTGASPASGNLLQIAWSCFAANAEGLPVVEDYLVEQPDSEPIPTRIEALTGIGSTEMMAARPGKFVLTRLKDAISQMSMPTICLIHYARFETPFLNDFFLRFGRRKALPFKTICTFEIAKRLYPNLPSRGIRALGGFLGLDLDELKRAPSHVATTCEIWKHLVKRLADEGVHSISDLEMFLSNKASARKGKLEYLLDPEKRLALPDCPGVYRMLNSRGRVLYVGKATSLRGRVNSHFRGRKRKTSTSFELLTQVMDIGFTQCRSPLEAALLEVDEIKKYDPPYNESLKNKNRKIWFYSHDLESGRVNFDIEHSIGPFASEATLENLMLLIKAIAYGELDPAIIYADAEQNVVEAGFELFLEVHQIEPFSDCSMRHLLCLGMRLYRALRNGARTLIRDSVCDLEEDP